MNKGQRFLQEQELTKAILEDIKHEYKSTANQILKDVQIKAYSEQEVEILSEKILIQYVR